MRTALALLVLMIASAAGLRAQAAGVMRASVTILPPAVAEVSEDEVRVRRDRQGQVEVALPVTAAGRPGRVVGVRAGGATRAVSLPGAVGRSTGASANADGRWTVTLNYPPSGGGAPARPEDTVVLYLVDS